MNLLETEIFELLTGDATLTGLLNNPESVYYGRGPEGVDPPYVVFQQLSSVPQYVLTKVAFENMIYLVKAVTLGPSSKLGGQIRDRFEELLQDAALSVAGYKTMKLRRESAIDYPESVPGGQEYRHRGSTFRVQLTSL